MKLLLSLVMFMMLVSCGGSPTPTDVVSTKSYGGKPVNKYIEGVVAGKSEVIIASSDNRLRNTVIGGATGYVGSKLLGIKSTTGSTLLGGGIGYATGESEPERLVTKFIVRVGDQFRHIDVEGRSDITRGDTVILEEFSDNFIIVK